MRAFLKELDESGQLIRVKREVSPKYEIPALIKKLDGRAVIFDHVEGHEDYEIAAGVCGSRELLARALNVKKEALLQTIVDAVDNPKPFKIVDDAPCHEVVEEEVDLTKLPILTHCEEDGGPFTTASIVVAWDKEYGFNASYHRLMLLDKQRCVARILPRHLDEFISRGNREIAVTIGNHPSFLFAAAISCEIGKSELAIANRLRDISYTKCVTNDILVPADCELVLEGVVTDEFVDEGPFPDLTGTYDIVRKQRVLKINCVTHRRNPIYQALLPGGSEHRLLMGVPREPTIFSEVNKVAKCIDVRITPGGCSWLHAVVQIRKEADDDGRRAVEAAFKGHLSLKHVIIVDEDIDIDNPEEIEWAVATRVQMDKDLILKPNEVGSSLDPSADLATNMTCKAGIDATIPSIRRRRDFSRAKIPNEDMIRVEDYL